MKYFYFFILFLFFFVLCVQIFYNVFEFGDLEINDCNGIFYDFGGFDVFYIDDNEVYIYINGIFGEVLFFIFI